MDLWQITITSKGRLPLFPTEAERRRAVRTLARVAGQLLAIFCIVDDHLHLVVVCSRPGAGRLAQAVERALGHLAASPFDPAHFEKVKDRRHLETLVGYVLGQPVRHGLPDHPALWTGSAFLDLVGARILPGLNLRLRQILPRLGTRPILRAVGLGGIDLRPLTLKDMREAGAHALAVSAAAALAAPPEPGDNATPSRLARRATVRLGRLSGFTVSEIATALGIHPRSVKRLAHRPVDDRILDAVRLRLALERHVERAAAAHVRPRRPDQCPESEVMPTFEGRCIPTLRIARRS
jgi:hypothetical protein